MRWDSFEPRRPIECFQIGLRRECLRGRRKRFQEVPLSLSSTLLSAAHLQLPLMRAFSLSLSSCWRRPKSPTHKLHSTHSELHSRRIALTVNQARARKKEREREWESRQELHSRRITLITDYPVRAYTRGSGRAREMRTSAVCTVKGQVRAGQHNRAMLSEVKQRRLVELPLL